MGVINVNSDSFYAGSRQTTSHDILNKAEQMLHDGAHILDLGAMSSRPGADIISADEELRRIIPAVTSICERFPAAIISVDTLRSKVAQEVINCGASCINDISAGTYDDEMMSVVAKNKVPYIIMHMQGLPADMQHEPMYENVVTDIMIFLSDKVRKAKAAGIVDIMIDPGFGFGKTLAHNYEIMRQMEVFKIFDLPILAGISRKSMIWKVLNTDADGALNGTTALNMYLLTKGASILRVHDVREAKECITLFERLR
jgi:dihydropteroate synthase